MLGGSKNIEKEFYKLWTLKEAEVKRNSIGIAHGLAKATFTKNESWASENYPADFVSYFLKIHLFLYVRKILSPQKLESSKLEMTFALKIFLVS